MTSNSIPTSSPRIFIQSQQFYLSSNSIPRSQSLPHVNISSAISRNRNPSISIRKPPNLPPTAAAATGGCYTTVVPSPEETLYELLGISQNVTLSDIKRAYKQMALKYHPDVSPPGRVEEYTMRFIQVQEAYETLSEPESLAVYDCNLAKGLAFSVKKGRWRETWEGQVAELKRRRTAEMGGRMSWAARIRKQRAVSDVDGVG